MVLVDARIDFAGPDPTPTKLVSVPTFVEQDISRKEPKGSYFVCRDADRLDVREIEIAALDVRHPQIRHLDKAWPRLLLGILRHTPNDVGYLAKLRPTPMRRHSIRGIRKHFRVFLRSDSGHQNNFSVPGQLRDRGTHSVGGDTSSALVRFDDLNDPALFFRRWQRHGKFAEVAEKEMASANPVLFLIEVRLPVTWRA